jgi:hypothetical protein
MQVLIYCLKMSALLMTGTSPEIVAVESGFVLVVLWFLALLFVVWLRRQP